jgi:uncharacterized protein YjbI with pentapeptide repeats
MKTKLEDLLKNLEEGENLIIGDQRFLNEAISDEYLQCSILGTITFSGMKFEGIDFTGSTFVNCVFKNCTFQDALFRKCDFTKSTFHTGTFLSCDFLEGSLRATLFNNFKFIETKFHNTNLGTILVESISVWKSNQSTLIQDSSNLENFLEASK